MNHTLKDLYKMEDQLRELIMRMMAFGPVGICAVHRALYDVEKEDQKKVA